MMNFGKFTYITTITQAIGSWILEDLNGLGCHLVLGPPIC